MVVGGRAAKEKLTLFLNSQERGAPGAEHGVAAEAPAAGGAHRQAGAHGGHRRGCRRPQ